jgi:hypothetical protein
VEARRGGHDPGLRHDRPRVDGEDGGSALDQAAARGDPHTIIGGLCSSIGRKRSGRSSFYFQRRLT